ncbi:hypothetical protein GCM10025868_17400 [Angustibacter aerolatus]|uniref:HAD family hydrolase n=1 Tax=Angustibacter aerolatus TaxID=1162965 RepID=A0ABQ6JE78_9ACTN|nr:hypothetical protein GCM10025868_17400 [Angustibacter aerolatus]
MVLATSGKPDQVDHFLDLLQCRDLLTAWTTSEDVGSTKPDTDLIEESLRRAGQERGIMLGDSRWDFESARRAGVQGVGVLTGGFSEPEPARRRCGRGLAAGRRPARAARREPARGAVTRSAPDAAPDGRDESATERADRNWNEPAAGACGSPRPASRCSPGSC